MAKRSALGKGLGALIPDLVMEGPAQDGAKGLLRPSPGSHGQEREYAYEEPGKPPTAKA